MFIVALKNQILMCYDKNDGNTSFAVERNLLSGNAVIFHVQQHLFCYTRSHLGGWLVGYLGLTAL